MPVGVTTTLASAIHYRIYFSCWPNSKGSDFYTKTISGVTLCRLQQARGIHFSTWDSRSKIKFYRVTWYVDFRPGRGWAHNRSYYLCYAVCECRHVVSDAWQLDRWSLPLLWHLSDISAICNCWPRTAPNFRRRSADPPGPAFPSLWTAKYWSSETFLQVQCSSKAQKLRRY